MCDSSKNPDRLIATSFVSQGNYFKCNFETLALSEHLGGGQRGEIYQFSKSSRKRLLDLFSKMGKSEVEQKSSVFITMTYGQYYPTLKECKRDLDVFMKRIQRAFPYVSGVWRMEEQGRGAPHFHIIFWGLKAHFNHLQKCMVYDLAKDDLKRIWGEVINPAFCDWSRGFPVAPFTKIEFIHSYYKLIYYVSKYCAKIEKYDSNLQFGFCGFNFVAYLTAKKSKTDFECLSSVFSDLKNNHINDTVFQKEKFLRKQENSGRWWGIHNKIFLPLAEKFTFSTYITSEENILNFINTVSESCKFVKKNILQGFCLYTDESKKLFDMCLNIEDVKDSKLVLTDCLSYLNLKCKELFYPPLETELKCW